MFIFISVTAAMMWAAFWGVIRLERSMGQAPRPPAGNHLAVKAMEAWAGKYQDRRLLSNRS